MAFLVPAVLAGAAAVAAPIAIHFLNRTRVKVVPWAAMRFLMESLQKNQRRLQVEDLILLLLRCLFIILLALAFARYVQNPAGSQDPTGSGPVVAVILLDQSASMGQSDGFQTRFDQAKEAASKTIGSLDGGSQVALFLVGARVDQVIPRPISNLPFVRRALDVAKLTDQTSDMGTAITLALDALKPFSGARKEIYVFSDRQVSAWPDMEEIQKRLADSPEVQMNVADLGPKAGEDNLALTMLKPESSTSAVGQLIGFLVEVSNFGTVPAAGLRVTLSVDDDPPVDETILETLEPGKSQVIRLNARFTKPGHYTLKAAIPADRMPADNERAVAVHVINQMNATIVENSKATKKNESRAAFFLANALVPVSPSRRADYFLKVDTAPPSWLASADLSQQKIIFLSNVGQINSAASKALEAYVREGGSIVIFPGDQVEPATYNDNPVLSPILPAKLGPRREPASGKMLSWQADKYTHPVTSLWNDPRIGNLGSVRATGFFPLQIAPENDKTSKVHPVVNYSDGTPAAVEGTYGKGHIVLFSSSATTDWTNLPIHPNFVPFLLRLVGFLSPDTTDEALAISPGTVFQAKVSSDLVSREMTAITPESAGKPRPAGKVEFVNKEAVVRYRDTASAGAYRLMASGEETPVAAFAVQMEAKESDLKMLSPDQLAALRSGEAPDPTHPTPGTATGPAKVRREFWIFFLGAAFLVALIEMMLAHRFSFAK